MRGRRRTGGHKPVRREALATSSGWLAGGRLVAAALGWIATVLIVRSLSADDWGRYSFVFAALLLVSVFADLGVGRVAVAALLEAGADRGRVAGSYFLLRSLMGIMGYGLAVAAIALGGYGEDLITATAIGGVVLLLSTPAHALEAVYQADSRLRPVALARIAGQIAYVAFVALVATAGGGLLFFMLPPVAYAAVDLAAKFAALPDGLRLRLGYDGELWRSLLREATPLAAGAILATALSRIDIVMLSRLDTFDAVGAYAVAYKFADLAHIASSAVTTALLALLVASWAASRTVFAANLRHATLLLALAGAMAIVEITLFAAPAIELIFGVEYRAADRAAMLVVAGEVLQYASALAFIVLLTVGRNVIYPLVVLGGVALNVGLNLWLIPARSYEGAALATLATEAAVAVPLVAAAIAATRVRPLTAGDGARIVAAALAGAAAGLGLDRIVSWPLAAACAAFVLLAVAHALRLGGPRGLADLGRGLARTAPPSAG